jgi:hypothetical protein
MRGSVGQMAVGVALKTTVWPAVGVADAARKYDWSMAAAIALVTASVDDAPARAETCGDGRTVALGKSGVASRTNFAASASAICSDLSRSWAIKPLDGSNSAKPAKQARVRGR